MRKTYAKLTTCLALTISAFCGAVTSAQAQAVTGIFGFDTLSWQYYQEGIEPTNISNLNWRTNNYNDTSWSSGLGFFAYEPDSPGIYNPLNTFLNRNVSGTSTPINTYYFRTHFTFPTNPTNTFLYFTNVVDDGLVLYLNGVRLYDLRVAANPPTYATFAGGTPAEGARELVIITNGTTPRVRQGDNVLAVEVHDSSATSTDIGFGLALGYRVLAPITIVQQPTNRVDALIGDTLDLSVVVTGDNPRYAWFKDNVFQTGQTNPTFRINNLQTGNAGTYWVVVSNTISSVRSSNSVVTVVPDTFPPELVTAAVNEGETNRVYAIFTEDVLTVNNRNPLASATNLANYTVSEVSNPSNKFTITAATVGVGQRSVRLTLNTNIDCSKEWVLTVRNLTDRRTNTIVPNPSQAIVGCQFRIPAVEFGAIWNYMYTYDEAQPPLPTNWYTTNYQVDANWTIGSAPFWYSATCLSNCFGEFGAQCPAEGTSVSVGFPTTVFRTQFIVPSNSPTVGTLRLTEAVDDGAIFYLNGKEILRNNMTNGPVTFNYLPPCTNNTVCGVQIYGLDSLLIGTNIFCAEVHSCDEFVQADFMFGCQLDIIVTNYPTRIPELKVRKTISPTRVILDWQPRGWRLQTSTNLANSNAWVNVTGITTNFTSYTNNPLTVPLVNWRFWRLCRP